MKQYKIPQEMNIEDKVIGPFTLKGFGFVFAGVAITFIFASLFKMLGLDMMTSIIIGGFFGSFALIAGFIPMNGRPLYLYTGPLFSFLSRPRQRVWSKKDEDSADILDTAEKETSLLPQTESPATPKESLSSARSRIKDLSLVVDTGGAYQKNENQIVDNDLAHKERRESEKVDRALEESHQKDEKKETPAEPLLSELASVDPKKKFEYKKPNTSEYKLDEYNKRNVEDVGTVENVGNVGDVKNQHKH